MSSTRLHSDSESKSPPGKIDIYLLLGIDRTSTRHSRLGRDRPEVPCSKIISSKTIGEEFYEELRDTFKSMEDLEACPAFKQLERVAYLSVCEDHESQSFALASSWTGMINELLEDKSEMNLKGKKLHFEG